MQAARSPTGRPRPCSPTPRSCAPISETTMLELAGVSVAYGQHRALDGIELSVARGEIVVLLGANGAGKTTLLKAIAGLVAPREGARLALDGRSLAGLPPHAIVEAGIALVPEGRGVFGELTVRDRK